MLYLFSGINSLYLFVNLILVPVPPFPTHLLFHPSLLFDSPFCSYICSLFHSRLKPTCFTNLIHVVSLLPPYCADRFIWATGFLFIGLVFFIFRFCAVRYIKLGSRQLWAHVNLPYRIVSYRNIETMNKQATGMHTKCHY